MPSNPTSTKNPSSDTSDDALFDQMFPASAIVEETKAPLHGAVIETGKGKRHVLDPFAAPLREGITDPRTDLATDHLMWLRVLGLAFAKDGHDAHGIYGLLHAARCEGALLERRQDRLYLVRGQIEAATWGSFYRPKLEERGDAVRALLVEGWR